MVITKLLAKIIFLSVVFIPLVLAEPYIAVTKGMHCSSCHSHQAGGGLRNTYGNIFAQNELAAQRLGDTDMALWTGSPIERVSVGGNIRTEYRYIDTPNTRAASSFDVTKGTIYGEVSLIKNRLSVYVDQQVAPGGSLNRESYVRIKSADQAWSIAAGQFFLPYGLY